MRANFEVSHPFKMRYCTNSTVHVKTAIKEQSKKQEVKNGV